LYADYSLWRAALTGEDLASARTYSETLVYFPLEALHPTNERLLDYAAQVIPQLYEAQLWDRPRVLNVVSFLVWQHHGAASVERLLTQLGQRYPAEPDWPFYLAELYQRQGDLVQARAVYEQVLAMDPEYAPAYLRLGMVAEASCAERSASCEGLQEAIRWYNAYHDRRPDDLSGLIKLAETYTALGRPEAALFQREFDARIDDRRIVAELLGLPVTDVTLGSNQVENAGFEEWLAGRPNMWAWWTMFNREPFGDAAFAGGSDGLPPFARRGATRIDGLWVQMRQDKSPARAGFWYWDKAGRALQPINLSDGEPYVFSFDYRTVRLAAGAARAWVSDDPDVLWAGYHGLPATDGAWHHFVAVGWNRAGAKGAIYPLLSSFGPGSVVYDNVGLRPVELSARAAVASSEARFRVIAGDHQ
jgi:tetratricopeptide (TPR) repeat protein